MFQDPYGSLNPRMTAEELIAEGLIVRQHQILKRQAARAGRRDDADGRPEPGRYDALPAFILPAASANASPSHALVIRPRILVCDEPVAALDVSVQAQVINLLQDMQRQLDLAIVFVAHDLAVVRHLYERIAVLNTGRVVEHGSREEIFGAPKDHLHAVAAGGGACSRSRRRTEAPGRAEAATGLNMQRYPRRPPCASVSMAERTQTTKRGPVDSFNHAHEIGMEGLYFRTVLDMTPASMQACCGRCVSARGRTRHVCRDRPRQGEPVCHAQAPELRAIGDGDIMLGFRRMMEACAAIDCRELWVATANYKMAFTGRLAYDRFHADVSWAEQLKATERFLKILAPIARDLGIHMNLETHEEIHLIRAGAAGGERRPRRDRDHLRHGQRAARRASGLGGAAVGALCAPDPHEGCAGRAVRGCARLPDAAAGGRRRGLPQDTADPGGGKSDNSLSIENAESHDDRPKPTYRMAIEIHDPQWPAGHLI